VIKPPSLLLRLSLSALGVVLVALGVIGFAVDRAFLAAEHVAMRERLEGAALAVLAGLDVDEDGEIEWTGAPADSQLTRPQSGLYAGVIGPENWWYSPSTLGVELPSFDRAIARGEQRWTTPDEQTPWHAYRMGLGWEVSEGRIIDLEIWTAEDPARIAASMASFRGDLWRWLGLAALVLALAELALLAQPVLVLRRVAGEVRQIEQGRRERISGQYPRELTPLTENLNALLTTERANAELYSQALGDLAHSLKTPLAVLNSQAERAEAIDPAELRETIAQMQVRIRAELERASRSARRTMLAPLDVAPVAGRVVRGLRKLYPGTRFDLECPDDLNASVEERDLMELLGNLLENAAKYGHGRVRLTLGPERGRARRPGLALTVEDNGEGLDPERFGELLARGVRGDERVEGQGLGLAIVRRIVDSYHGEIEAGVASGGGLRITIRLRPE